MDVKIHERLVNSWANDGVSAYNYQKSSSNKGLAITAKSWFAELDIYQKHPAGSGMERVGVSKSLLGTYDQHWDLPVILPLMMMQNV